MSCTNLNREKETKTVRRKLHALAAMLILFFPLTSWSQDKVVLVVKPFTLDSDAAFPYDLKQLQISVHAEIKTRFAKDAVDVVMESPASARGKVYTVEGQFSNWKGGSTAKRILVGFGSGREGVDFSFFVIDETGKKIIEREVRIKAPFIGSAYQGNVGQLAHPVADKIGDKVKDARIFQKEKG